MNLIDSLRWNFDADGPERCGVITEEGIILTIENIHPDPMHYFAMPEEVLRQPGVIGTWHTHPRTGPNLSVADYRAFKAFPTLEHYIISASEIWCFQVINGILARNENPFTRVFKDPIS